MPFSRHSHKVVPPRRRRIQISSSSSSSFYVCLFYLIVLTICLPSFIDYHQPGVQAAVVVGSGKTSTLRNVKTDTEQSKGEFHSLNSFKYLGNLI